MVTWLDDNFVSSGDHRRVASIIVKIPASPRYYATLIQTFDHYTAARCMLIYLSLLLIL